MEELTYCYISFGSKNRTYCYLADDNYEIGDIVRVPTGDNNEPGIGQIKTIDRFSRENAPYPVEKTKHIIEALSKEEIDKLPLGMKRGFEL